MSDIRQDRRYTKTHEWVKLEGTVATVGISDHAQASLGDITYVDLPDAGAALSAGDTFGSIESVKAASDLYAPVGGEVQETNGALEDAPETVNTDPYGAGWLIRIGGVDSASLTSLMDAAAYGAFLATESEQ